MKKFYCLTLFIVSVVFFQTAYAGNLGIGILSSALFGGALPGDTISYMVSYYNSGEGQATNVQVSITIPAELDILQILPQPSSQSGGTGVWNAGELKENSSGYIIIQGVIKKTVSLGTVIKSTAAISGSTTGDSPEDNTAVSEVSVAEPGADLWVMNWGLLESLESGSFFTTELNVNTSFEVMYYNFATAQAENVKLTDTLPEGVQYISASPAPTNVSGNVLAWDIGSLEKFGFGKIVINVKSVKTGSWKNKVNIETTTNESSKDNNSSSFLFTVVPLIQPRLLKPAVTWGSDDVIILGANPVFEGLARAGAVVTLYSGDSLGTFGDFGNLHPVALGSVTSGTDRHWSIKLQNLEKAKTYYLYLRAEYNGETSSPFMNFWQPMKFRIEPILDSAGFDMDHFIVSSGGNDIKPGALGSKSSTTPDDSIIIRKRFNAPPSIVTDTGMWEHHKMLLKITDSDGNETEEYWPLSRVETPAAKSNKALGHWGAEDFIYVHKGFGPGSKVEVWCLPIYYTDEGLPIVGLVWIKCHEILIDPAGYVYDIDIAGSEYTWPSVPPEKSLITTATVTALERQGDNSFSRWEAEKTGQVNPQVTDETTEDKIKVKGYFAFYVPSGQYQLNVTAEDYAEYVSPVLTVIDEPIFHNCGLNRVVKKGTGVDFKITNTSVPSLVNLEQNYPNPFNPVTSIGYYLPKEMSITLKIYDLLGHEIATLVNNERRGAGRHVLQFDGSSLATGPYFYCLSAGNYVVTKKLLILK